MRDLKQKVSMYFEISSTSKFILQRYDKEWDSYIDLGDEDVLQDRDKLQVIIITECTQASGKSPDSDMKVKYYGHHIH